MTNQATEAFFVAIYRAMDVEAHVLYRCGTSPQDPGAIVHPDGRLERVSGVEREIDVQSPLGGTVRAALSSVKRCSDPWIARS